MGKKRTRKEKQNAKHQFNISWNPSSSEASVKRQNNIGYQAKNSRREGAKSADNLRQEAQTRSIKRDLVKSLILISFILCLELVVYLAWNVKR